MIYQLLRRSSPPLTDWDLFIFGRISRNFGVDTLDGFREFVSKSRGYDDRDAFIMFSLTDANQGV